MAYTLIAQQLKVSTTVDKNEATLRAGAFVMQPGGFKAFIPAPLPPSPPIVPDGALQDLLERANRALGRLDGITLLLPSPELFLYTYIRKEAVLSSQIEGTRSSLSDLLLFENAETPGVPIDDIQEVSNYVQAMTHGLGRLREGFPLSLRLLREIHGILLAGARGGEKTPGEFRRSQNWIKGSMPGNALYVPPPVHEMMTALDNLEKFLQDEPGRTPLLMKAGLAHAQFETIHPFLDGNGRLGRLLVTFLFCAEQELKEPLLYLSLYLRNHRAEYYDALQAVRVTGNWEAWLTFFLTGVFEVATEATTTTQRLVAMFEEDRRRIVQTLGRGAGSALRVHDLLKERAVVSIPKASVMLELTQPTVTAAIERLVEMGIAREYTGKQRNRQFMYPQYLKLLDQGVS